MFTGITEKVGEITNIEERRGQRRFTVKTGFSELTIGERVAVNGISVTVLETTEKGDALFSIEEEIFERSNLKNSTKVNLERALPVSGRFGGHFVNGQVDATAMLLTITESSDHYRVVAALDPKYGRYCVERGAITLDGVSVSIHSLDETKAGEFMIACHLPFEIYKNTTFKERKPGDALNVEVDVLAKYIERLGKN